MFKLEVLNFIWIYECANCGVDCGVWVDFGALSRIFPNSPIIKPFTHPQSDKKCK